VATLSADLTPGDEAFSAICGSGVGFLAAFALLFVAPHWIFAAVWGAIAFAVATFITQNRIRSAAESKRLEAETAAREHRATEGFRRRYAIEHQRNLDREYLASGLAEVDRMSGMEFEKYVAARLRAHGWKVSPTATTGDYGVDLVAQKAGESIAVQCKRYGKPVGVSAVQQVVSGAMHHQCTASMVVCNQEFTKAAKQLAHTHNCRLIGRSELPRWTP
jgi:restriction system protein